MSSTPDLKPQREWDHESVLVSGGRDPEYLETRDLLVLSIRLSDTRCNPLYKSAVSLNRNLKEVVAALYP